MQKSLARAAVQITALAVFFPLRNVTAYCLPAIDLARVVPSAHTLARIFRYVYKYITTRLNQWFGRGFCGFSDRPHINGV
jgi:hypothetical protein